MSFYNLIETRYLTQYLLTEGALFIGILLFKFKPQKSNNIYTVESPRFSASMFGLSFFLFISLSILVYIERGIPLLVPNRLEIYNIGGGFGLISRALDVLLVVIICYFAETIYRNKWNSRHWLFTFIVVLIQILSGAKSAVLTVVFIMSLYSFYFGVKGEALIRAKKFFFKLFVLALLGFLAVADIQSAGDTSGNEKSLLLTQAALRIVNNGDAFMYAYPQGVIEQLDGKRPVEALLREYLAFLKLVNPNELPLPVGLQLSRFFNGGDTFYQTNSKHNIFGYVNFGLFGGIAYSLVLGVLISLVRYKLFNSRKKNIAFGAAYILINLGFITTVNDGDNAGRYIINIIFILIPLSAAAYIISRNLSARHIRPLPAS